MAEWSGIQKVHYNEGRPDIPAAFLLSAPGSKEQLHGRPAAGTTGNNLDIVIGHLHAARPALFPSARRYDYTITNAVDQVHFAAATGRTEATDDEIRDPANMARLRAELGAARVLVCLGNKAQLAGRLLQAEGLPVQVLAERHPGIRGLLSIRADARGAPILKGQAGSTALRLEVVARRILDQLT
ncbi:MAG TPA: uracil-DNA glycosylase family protein [Alphaproteobacteria bacterium]|nr:uracil-DNA glycosylase family protein [Alphaproteobacteria bacterium]